MRMGENWEGFEEKRELEFFVQFFVFFVFDTNQPIRFFFFLSNCVSHLPETLIDLILWLRLASMLPQPPPSPRRLLLSLLSPKLLPF